jgi:hypothetical protein
MSGIHLVYQYFKVKTSPTLSIQEAMRRQREYDECLFRNLVHNWVRGVHLLLENESDQVWLRKTIDRLRRWLGDRINKLTSHVLGRRMLYSDAFQYCNVKLKGSIAVIMNADIIIDKGVTSLFDEKGFPNQCLFENTLFSLTRHEYKLCKLQSISEGSATERIACGCPLIPSDSNHYSGSHDSFWFIPPITSHFIKCVQHVQNRWGAEHLVIKELIAHGYRVLNPSRSILTLHNHASALRPWKQEDGAEEALAQPRDHLPLYPIHLTESYPWWPRAIRNNFQETSTKE